MMNANEVGDALECCITLIRKLSVTCCQPHRSDRMDVLIKSIGDINVVYSEKNDDSLPDKLITFVEKTGAIIGELHVSCCIAEREKIYQELLTLLNRVFLMAWQMKGISH